MFCLLAVFLTSLSTTMLMISSETNFEERAEGYHSMIENWNKDFIYDIKLTDSGTRCPTNLEEGFKAKWPGTKEGCDCINVGFCHYDNRTYGGLEKGSCSTNKTQCGCRDIGGTPGRTLLHWAKEKTICFLRVEGMNFRELYKEMNIDGQCSPNTKLCGSTSGISNGLCIPKEFNCPITEISFKDENPDSKLFFSSLTGVEKNIYITRENVSHPIVDTALRFGEVCLNPANRYKRSDYKLISEESKNCKVDTRYINLRVSEGEQALFDNNDVQYKHLPAFNPNNSTKYSRFVRNLIEWSPKCSDLIESIHDHQEEVKMFQSKIGTTTTLSIIGLLLAIMSGCCGIELEKKGLDESKNKGMKIITIVVRLIFNVVIMCCQASILFQARKIKGIFDKISKEKCSDDFTNQFFANLEEDILLYMHTYQWISLLIFIYGIVTECVYHFYIFEWNCKYVSQCCECCCEGICGIIKDACKRPKRAQKPKKANFSNNRRVNRVREARSEVKDEEKAEGGTLNFKNSEIAKPSNMTKDQGFYYPDEDEQNIENHQAKKVFENENEISHHNFKQLNKKNLTPQENFNNSPRSEYAKPHSFRNSNKGNDGFDYPESSKSSKDQVEIEELNPPMVPYQLNKPVLSDRSLLPLQDRRLPPKYRKQTFKPLYQKKQFKLSNHGLPPISQNPLRPHFGRNLSPMPNRKGANQRF